jgi:UDP-4-amino-4,6-dideoxy-N-acetyl-beta-L-altrosamine N-acetyltransferase
MKDQVVKKQLYSFTNFILLNINEKVMVWNWRNHAAIRRWMYDSSLIPFEDHLKFLDSLLGNNLKTYYLVLREKIPIGVISVTASDDVSVDLGFYLSPGLHKKHLSIEFWYHVLSFLFETLCVRKICGYVRVENLAVNSLNELFGFGRRNERRMEDGMMMDYYYSELNSETWFEKVKTNKAILQKIDRSDQI